MLESLALDISMIDLEVEDGLAVGLTAEMIRAQLDLLVRDEVFRPAEDLSPSCGT